MRWRLALGTLGGLFLATPVLALLLRADWAELPGDIAGSMSALWLSLAVPLVATVIAMLVGVPLAWLLVSAEGWRAALLRVLVVLPIGLPPVVAGVALLAAYGRRGVVGDLLPFSLPFTTAAAVVAVAYVALPFVVLTLEAGFRSLDLRYVEQARTLGANRQRTWWRVIVPMTLPALAAGTVLAWARALGEFGATITFAGNVEGETRTLPLAIFVQLERDPTAAFSLSVLMLFVTILVLGLTRRAWVTT